MQALSVLADSFAEYEDLDAILDAGARWFDIPVVPGISVALEASSLVLLMAIAWCVAREVKSMTVVESAGRGMRRNIEAPLRARPEIRSIISLITLQWGKEAAVQCEMPGFEPDFVKR